ncbi:tetratricopeptide repeat protein [Marinilabiliaceae bacterium JC017]|nr:tetratricopeptide repeat protein [Marinilabiliaceae bacterium JC017]
MRRVTLLFILLYCLGISAQNHKISGDKYFRVYNYERALKDYMRVLKKKPDDVDLLKKIVVCYLKDNQLKGQALPYLKRLEVLDEQNSQVLFDMSQAYFHTHQFDSSLIYINNYAEAMTDKPGGREKAIQLKRYIENARAMVMQPVDVAFHNLGNRINTKRSEINPFVTNDESILFYASDQRYHSKGRFNYFNVCVSLMEKDQWKSKKTIGSAVNTGFDEIVAGISVQGEELFVFHNRYVVESVAYAPYLGDYQFEEIRDFGPPLKSRGGKFGVWMSAGKDTILYASETTNGSLDLFYSIKLPNSQWGPSRPLPGKVNSSYDENFPVLTDGGRRLFFSSNGLQSMGGYDIFYADLDTVTGEWGDAVNIGYPVNDTYDNYSISWVRGKRYAYVSAIRPEGLGNRDIYKVVFKDKDPAHLIYKCYLTMEQDSNQVIPDFKPDVLVTDMLGNIVGQYATTPDSASFILALTPGEYWLSIKSDEMAPFEKKLEVNEKWYPPTARIMHFILQSPKDEE